MTKHTITAIPLASDIFSPYGDVIETEGANHFSINKGTIERYHDLASVTIGAGNGGRALISIVSVNTITALPAQIKLVERHPLGSQAFIPMDNTPMIVVVAPAGDDFQIETLQAFVTNGRQGINYHPGIWHMPLIAPKLEQQWLVVDRGGPGNNCDELCLKDSAIFVDVANH